MADFPTALTNAIDNVTDVLAKHINNIEAKIGIDGSAVTTSIDYKLSGITGTNRAASRAGMETLSNKTLTAPVLNDPEISGGTATDMSATSLKVVTDLSDTNGKELIKVSPTASAVNEVTLANAATGGSPKIAASGDDTNINFILDGKGTGLVIPRLALLEGQLLNGQFVSSVASSNLTLSLKTLAGGDPSAADPVYVRIGNTVRSVVAALAVTKAAGTNWGNAGSTELATKEVDYFIYLGYNASDGVVIGFSRVPYAVTYSDFSVTTTVQNYCAISTITNATATDAYEVVGRFNAILSAGAGYTWSIPATSVIINRPIYESRWLDYLPTFSAQAGAWNSVSSTISRYKVDRRTVHIRGGHQGTTTGSPSYLGITFPFTPAYPGNETETMGGCVRNGSGWVAPANMMYQTSAFNVSYSFTNGANRGFLLQGEYEV